MKALLKSTWILLFAVTLMMMGNGLQGPLLGVRAVTEGFNSTVTGFIMSGYFAGLLFGSYIAPKLVRQVGHIRVFAAFASIASTCILTQAAFIEPVTWIFMRFLTGMCMSGLYVVVESWFNDKADNNTRGTLLAIYSTLQLTGVALGQLLLNLASPSGYDLFLLTSVLISLSLVPVALANISAPRVEQTESVSWGDLYKISPFGVIGLFLLGMVQSVLFGMSAVFASLIGLSVVAVSLFASMPFIGGILLLFPLGSLSDKLDRRKIVIVTSAGSAIFALAGFMVFENNFYTLFLVTTIYGGLSYPMYSLLIAHANDNARPEQMLSVCSGLVMIFGLGATIGPLVVGFTMDWYGYGSFFMFLAIIHTCIAIFGIYRTTKRASVEERLDYVPLPMRATPIAAKTLAKDMARQSRKLGPRRFRRRRKRKRSA
ncbi:MAG: MFS transporter [Hyphomicrobiales bacterium]|nr:MFS transporter [Hyphomicrobiales bacterium]